jgi:hypothetical protein
MEFIFQKLECGEIERKRETCTSISKERINTGTGVRI